MQKNIYQEGYELLQKRKAFGIRTTLKLHDGAEAEIVKKELVERPPVQSGSEYDSFSCRKEGSLLLLYEPVLPKERLILFGAGHVSAALCELAAKIGFSVTVCDNRPDYLTEDRFPLAAERICGPFSRTAEEAAPGPYDYAAVLTSGHAFDLECLRKLLSGPEPAYMGLISSRRRFAGVREKLLQENYEEKRIMRIHSPIGLDIKAETSAEIAVSIAAELILCRHTDRKVTTGLDAGLFGEMAGKKGTFAVATVLAASGSTPRKAGAKMAVFADGTICGTIGGGSMEYAVIQKAQTLSAGECRIDTFDMNGNPVTEDDMVCGGSMTVLLEGYFA